MQQITIMEIFEAAIEKRWRDAVERIKQDGPIKISYNRKGEIVLAGKAEAKRVKGSI